MLGSPNFEIIAESMTRHVQLATGQSVGYRNPADRILMAFTASSRKYVSAVRERQKGSHFCERSNIELCD
jgi:hypothetical protein